MPGLDLFLWLALGYEHLCIGMGGLGEGSSYFRPIFIAAIPLPPLPELTPKAVYPSVRPSLFLPLWDALQYLHEVSTAWALEWGKRP